MTVIKTLAVQDFYKKIMQIFGLPYRTLENSIHSNLKSAKIKNLHKLKLKRLWCLWQLRIKIMKVTRNKNKNILLKFAYSKKLFFIVVYAPALFIYTQYIFWFMFTTQFVTFLICTVLYFLNKRLYKLLAYQITLQKRYQVSTRFDEYF